MSHTNESLPMTHRLSDLILSPNYVHTADKESFIRECVFDKNPNIELDQPGSSKNVNFGEVQVHKVETIPSQFQNPNDTGEPEERPMRSIKLRDLEKACELKYKYQNKEREFQEKVAKKEVQIKRLRQEYIESQKRKQNEESDSDDDSYKRPGPSKRQK